ncbi:AMP-binding protein, partial [Escherichia coli]|nr:AMP-binding protein [Escherichia coli]
YLIFTSGSTGKPKGVRVAQQNLAAFAEQQRRAFGDRDGLRVVQFAAVGFDAYIWELVLTVVCAGTLL